MPATSQHRSLLEQFVLPKLVQHPRQSFFRQWQPFNGSQNEKSPLPSVLFNCLDGERQN